MLFLDKIFFEAITEFVWYMILSGGLICYIASLIFSLYKLPLQMVSVLAVVLSVYNLGILENEAKWDAKMKDLKIMVQEAEADTEILNTSLVNENQDKRRKLKEAADKQTEITDRLNDAVDHVITMSKQGINVTPNEVVNRLIESEQKKYAALSESQKKEYDLKIQELIKFSQECTPVPDVIIKQHNKSSTNPRLREIDKEINK